MSFTALPVYQERYRFCFCQNFSFDFTAQEETFSNAGSQHEVSSGLGSAVCEGSPAPPSYGDTVLLSTHVLMVPQPWAQRLQESPFLNGGASFTWIMSQLALLKDCLSFA